MRRSLRGCACAAEPAAGETIASVEAVEAVSSCLLVIISGSDEGSPVGLDSIFSCSRERAPEGRDGQHRPEKPKRLRVCITTTAKMPRPPPDPCAQAHQMLRAKPPPHRRATGSLRR